MESDTPPRDQPRVLTAVVAAFAGSFAATLAYDLVARPTASATETEASPYANLAIFARALAHVELSHVEPPDQDELIYGAIRGMIDTLDPHSSFLDPEEVRALEADTEGAFGGIGGKVLMPTYPACRRLATRCARSMSRVYTRPPRP